MRPRALPVFVFVLAVTIYSTIVVAHSSPSEENFRRKRKADPPWARISQDEQFGPPGYGRANGNNNNNNNNNNNKWQTDVRGGPPGLNGRKPPGWVKNGKHQDEKDTRINQDEGSLRPGYEERCGKANFRCGSGECLPINVRCNRITECRDSSDEANCATTEHSVQPIDGTNPTEGCVLPDKPEAGSYELGGCGVPCGMRPGDVVPLHSVLNLSCASGFVLTGSGISVCLDNGWYPRSSCVKTCPALRSTSLDLSCTSQGEPVSCTERARPGTKARLACKRSYRLPVTDDPGYRELICLEDGTWDRRLFRCLPECGTIISQGTALVVRGFSADLGRFPWHVGVYRTNERGDYEQICGGTLINSDLVVSAAHCFYDEVRHRPLNSSRYAVAAGKRHRDWYKDENYAQKSKVEQVLLAKRYQGVSGNFAQDIAILKLADPFELTALVRPVCLDWESVYEREQLQPGQIGKAVGWGKTIEGLPSEDLQEINMPFVPYDRCLAAVPNDFRGYITSDKFCAGWLNGSSLCDGDSGGGLCFERDGTWYLRGVVSVSPVNGDSCDYNSYVGFTYVSQFLHWIRTVYVQS